MAMNIRFKKYANRYMYKLKDDANYCYKSYEHCRQCYMDNRNDKSKYNLIALYQYGYLASFGMFRNSFLRCKDYLFNVPIVEKMCQDGYANLACFSPFQDNVELMTSRIIKLKKEIEKYYIGKEYIEYGTNERHVIEKVSDNLISKIILGTIGCVPAYDRYAVRAMKELGIEGKFNKNSLNDIVKFALKNRKTIEALQREINNPLYTPMRIIDMYLWEKGRELVMQDEIKKKSKQAQ